MNFEVDIYDEHNDGIKFEDVHNVEGVERVERLEGRDNVVGEDVVNVEDNVIGEGIDGSDGSDDIDFEGHGLSFDNTKDERALGLDDDIYEQVKIDETNYCSDEPGSSDSDASDNEKEPKYPRFKMNELNKNYKFKVGLEFGSLEEFKEAITECKVGNKHTYRMKRWVGNHMCGRVLNNSTAISKWVAKVVAARMSSSDSIKIRDIVSEIRISFSVGISMSRAWKAKQLAKSVVEGDATKQYNFL
ncbi:hypothetical protein KIW84_070924 [Lathyrus oleraceus]|uniref:Transposase MuDR plant domain-containing protein n=1 Tax=Pisum sativum TaxID=3888 RepID=A0A9D4VI52_PEA|nr:hypothetical protein KIW84_070924 [Pisum sativum]